MKKEKFKIVEIFAMLNRKLCSENEERFAEEIFKS